MRRKYIYIYIFPKNRENFFLFANSTTSIAIGGSVFNYYENFDSMQEKFYNIFYKFSLYFQISNELCSAAFFYKNRNISFREYESSNLFDDGKVSLIARSPMQITVLASNYRSSQ